MTTSADLLNRFSLDDYAAQAFSLDPTSRTGFGEGGVYAGPIANSPTAQPWHSSYSAPDNAAVRARARLVTIATGKVLVRWAGTGTGADWKSAAGGIWWTSDNMADYIVQKTLNLYGRQGDTRNIARQYAQVKNDWSDMGTVVVCKTIRPIKVLIGVGRPVLGVPVAASDMGNDLQLVILTSVSSPKDRKRRTFIGDQIMENLWLGTSSAFTDWWLRAAIVNRRRVAQRIELKGR